MSKVYEFPYLPKGMGATIGNFVRRSVYCQRKKWDIIGFRLNDLHEFSTIPNSTDMVTDLLVRLNDLKFTLKPELQSLVQSNLANGSSSSFNMEQYFDSVRIFNTMNSEKVNSEAIIAISLFCETDCLSSDMLTTWFNVNEPAILCQMMAKTSLNLTLFLAEVQGSMSTEESYAYITSAGITSTGFQGNYEGNNDIITLPGSNRGDVDVTCLYEEKLGRDTLKLIISPDTPESRAIVKQSILDAVLGISAVVGALN